MPNNAARYPRIEDVGKRKRGREGEREEGKRA